MSDSTKKPRKRRLYPSARVPPSIVGGNSFIDAKVRDFAKKPSSRRLAIELKCIDCVGGGADSDWRTTIRECGQDCPLHPFRPYRQEDEYE